MIETQNIPKFVHKLFHKNQLYTNTNPDLNGFYIYIYLYFYVLIRNISRFGVDPMATFLGLKQIWVWVKKLPILFFVTSFISFEPKLKMDVVAASISSTSLFSPYALARPKTHNPQPHKLFNSNSKRKQPLRNPLAPPPRTDDREMQLHPTPRRRFDIHPHSNAAPPHTLTLVRWVFSLFFSSLTFAHFELCMYPIHQGKNLPHAGKAIPTSNVFDLLWVKSIYGFGFWFVEEGHDWFRSGFWGAWRVGCDLGFGGGRFEILGCHGGHQRGVVVLWVDLGSWGCG